MVAPALLPLCHPGGAAGGMIEASGWPLPLVSVAAVGLHTAAMLAVAGAAAVVVYEWVGVGFLRRGWINLDLVWTAALLGTGLLLLLAL
jgi:hypothetical protein